MGKLTISMAMFNSFLYVYQVLTMLFATKTWLNASDEARGIVGFHCSELNRSFFLYTHRVTHAYINLYI